MRISFENVLLCRSHPERRNLSSHTSHHAIVPLERRAVAGHAKHLSLLPQHLHWVSCVGRPIVLSLCADPSFIRGHIGKLGFIVGKNPVPGSAKTGFLGRLKLLPQFLWLPRSEFSVLH